MRDEATEMDVAMAPCPHHPADCDGTPCAAKRQADALAQAPRYEMVYRCHYDGLDPSGCSWSTTDYAEIDAHEASPDVGHFVVGQVEDTTALRGDA